MFVSPITFGKVTSVNGDWAEFKLYKKQFYFFNGFTGVTIYYPQSVNTLFGVSGTIITTKRVDLALMGVDFNTTFKDGDDLYIDRSQITTQGSYEQVIFTNGNSIGLCYATEDNTIGGSTGEGLWWYDGTSTPYNIYIGSGKGFATIPLPTSSNGWGPVFITNKNTGIYVASSLEEGIDVSGPITIFQNNKVSTDYKGWFTIKQSY